MPSFSSLAFAIDAVKNNGERKGRRKQISDDVEPENNAFFAIAGHAVQSRTCFTRNSF
jgi:hypothetical protein